MGTVKQKMIDVTYKIEHLTIQGANEDAMRIFYRDILVLHEQQISGNEFSYSFIEGGEPFLHIQFNGEKPETQRGGLYHYALLLPDTASLAALINRLLRVQYPMGAGDHDVSEAFYLNDPDGNGIELYHDRPEEGWKWDNGLVTMGTANVDVQALLNHKSGMWSGFPDGTTIGHVHFVGDKVATGDDFFLNLLGMELTSTIEDSAHFYSHNHYHHHHAYNTWLGNNVKMRKGHETGLINWSVSVNEDYFERLLSQNADYLIDDESLMITDPFNSQLIVRKSQA